jgi:hypothetical protein
MKKKSRIKSKDKKDKIAKKVANAMTQTMAVNMQEPNFRYEKEKMED